MLLDDEIHRGAVQKLDGRQRLTQVAACGGVCGEHRIEGGEAKEGQVHGGGQGGQREGATGDHAQGSLGANEELAQVVARVVLAQRRKVVEHRAVGQHRLQTEQRAAE